MNQTICRAIRDRRVLSFIYEEGGRRTVEPHCHGISTAGNEVLRGFQTGGYSSSGRPVDWKMLMVAKMRSLRITDQTFAQNRPDYNPWDSKMSRVCCHV